MSHAQSLVFPYLTYSVHSTRTPIQTSLLFPSHGDDHFDDPRPGAFGQLAESNTLTVYAVGHMDVTGLWKREISALTQAAMLVAGCLYQEEKDVGGQWRTERRLVETAAAANEIFEETQVNFWTIHLWRCLSSDDVAVAERGLQDCCWGCVEVGRCRL